ncbi:hypothetical protein C0989_004131 [Termitomyces sp. Mn162]|nr:hypothetical protein C0989_004131 [Termitomyces sp. Mn162]
MQFLPKVLPALVNSGASGTFISSQLDLQHNNLNKPLKLQIFDRSPITIEITQYHDNTLTFDNDLQFQAQLLITQLPPLTLIVLGLPWLQDVNPNIDWKNLTMQFPSPKASLAAAIPLCLQSVSGSDVSDPGANTSGAAQSPSTFNSDPEGERNTTLPVNNKIIGTVPFACILQEGTPTFQLQITPALPEEHLCAETTLPVIRLSCY